MEITLVKLPVQFGRPVSLKSYIKSHSQLLLCGGRDERRSTRLEILFKDVVFLSLGEDISDASLRFATREEDDLIANTTVPFDWKGRRAYVLGRSLNDGYVIARGVVWGEDLRRFGEPSSIMPGLYDPEPEQIFGGIE